MYGVNHAFSTKTVEKKENKCQYSTNRKEKII